MKKIRRKALYCLACLALIWLGWQVAQRLVILYPSRQTGATPKDYGVAFIEQWIDAPAGGGTRAGRVQVWWIPAANASAPAVLYLHGNESTMSTDIGLILSLRQAGFSVMAIDYRGYGESALRLPSETSVYIDAGLGWLHFLELTPQASKRLLYGHSMGSAIAIDLAGRANRLDGLIVDGAFTSAADVGRAMTVNWLPLASLLRQKFLSQDKIEDLKMPQLFIHCTADEVIPVDLGLRLYGLSQAPKQQLLIEGGDHDHCYRAAPQRWRQAIRKMGGMD
ncbi:alpha/beta hydrolase [Chromobacterium sp. IIBBL 290-4]|uniref:alpha/beta hydrolase n=1 Tax=Chromobacterium sp. IIBBL 290-4 TaxID=2953890 RepID=UPI0020B7B116|nr:alpha/beta hydrolase [Chromobacterium sp. IIBBL 290-4]UTH73850.1 alpha/beta hydrolase [Chromobacterium sp. IIBBL 290-4]